MNKTTESSQIDESTPAECAVRIEIPTLEDFAGIKQGVNDTAFPCAIWAEKQRDWFQVHDLPATDPLEILDLDSRNHGLLSNACATPSGDCFSTEVGHSSPRKARWTRDSNRRSLSLSPLLNDASNILCLLQTDWNLC